MAFQETAYHPYDFANRRHIGPSPSEIAEMLRVVGAESLEALIAETVPAGIRQAAPLDWGPALSEQAALHRLRQTAAKNRALTSLIGQGYHGTVTPPVIQRNILENPAWYTAYTPYQPEISQGRLEALLNYQTMVCDLTGLDVANAEPPRRGDGGGGGDGALPARVEVEGGRLLRRRRLPPADDRRDPHPGRALRLAGDRRRPLRRPRRRTRSSGRSSSIPAPSGTSTTSPGRSRRCTRRGRSPAWPPIRWR